MNLLNNKPPKWKLEEKKNVLRPPSDSISIVVVCQLVQTTHQDGMASDCFFCGICCRPSTGHMKLKLRKLFFKHAHTNIRKKKVGIK